MEEITTGFREYRKLWFNCRFTRVRRRRLLVGFSWLFWIARTFTAMAAEVEISCAPRHIYLPDLSILEEIVKGTTGIFRDDDEEEQCRVSKNPTKNIFGSVCPHHFNDFKSTAYCGGFVRTRTSYCSIVIIRVLGLGKDPAP
jgi:hypothetical protein